MRIKELSDMIISLLKENPEHVLLMKDRNTAEFLDVLRAAGYSVNENDVEMIFDFAFDKKQPVDDEALDSVAGGTGCEELAQRAEAEIKAAQEAVRQSQASTKAAEERAREQVSMAMKTLWTP